jgi:pimeloyl-ACP methyl ester carboxylesterase
MESLPKTYDVYCIDLPGWGISKDPLIDLANVELDQVYKYYAQTVIAVLAEIHPLKNATFTLVGHSLGSFLLLKSITYIPLNRVNKLVLTCLPGIEPQTSRYPYFFATYFVYGFEAIFKQWWSRHLFCAFLYRKRTQLETLKRMHAFIPNGVGYKIVGRHTPFKGISPIKVELLDASNYVRIDLINGSKDALVDIRPVRAFVKTTIHPKTIKLHEFEGYGHMVFSRKELFKRLINIINDDNLLSTINIK